MSHRERGRDRGLHKDVWNTSERGQSWTRARRNGEWSLHSHRRIREAQKALCQTVFQAVYTPFEQAAVKSRQREQSLQEGDVVFLTDERTSEAHLWVLTQDLYDAWLIMRLIKAAKDVDGEIRISDESPLAGWIICAHDQCTIPHGVDDLQRIGWVSAHSLGQAQRRSREFRSRAAAHLMREHIRENANARGRHVDWDDLASW